MDYISLFNSIKKSTDCQKKEQILILDGLNLFIRVFSVVPALDTNGKHIGGLLGFLRTVALLSRQFQSNRIVICFDGPGGSLRRKKLYPDYKQNRKMTDKLNRTHDFLSKEEEYESMKEQLFRVIRYLENLPCDLIVIDNIEADDSIAYSTQFLKNENSEITIVSSDKDFLQLIDGEKVKVYNPVKKKLYTEQDVYDEFGVISKNFLTYRLLMGDTSDNISGVKGIGLKTLLKELPLFNEKEMTWEDLLIEIDQINPKKKTLQTLIESRDIIERNYHLMQLHDVDISASAKTKIIEILQSKKPLLNKIQIVNFLKEDCILQSFKDLDKFFKAFYI